jgi:hypothetical protein
MIDSLVQWLDKFATRPEDLQLVIFGCSNHNPGVILVPIEVADTVGEAAVHKQPKKFVSMTHGMRVIVLTAQAVRPQPPLQFARHQSC